MKPLQIISVAAMWWWWYPFVQIVTLSHLQKFVTGDTFETRLLLDKTRKEEKSNLEIVSPESFYTDPDQSNRTLQSLQEQNPKLVEDKKIYKDIRKIIKYKNLEGKRSAAAVAATVHHEFDIDQYIVMEINPKNLVELEKNINIESVEDDVYWTQKGILDEVLSPEDLERFFSTPPTTTATATATTATPNNSSTRYFHRTLQGEMIPYGIQMVQGPAVPIGPYRAVVCIVDTGIALGHPDFNKANIAGSNRQSMVDKKWLEWNKDVRGHGTHVSGTVAARAWNNYAVRGMGNIPLFITRGLSDDGKAYESDILQSMQQCVDGGSKIINLSLSGGTMSSAMRTLIDRLYASNIMIVAAAGNDGKRLGQYPASYEKVVSVGAVDGSETRWKGSNYGPWLELTAPGTGIPSTGFTWKGEYSVAIYTGTSMATPHVAGAAALLWSHYPQCSVTQIRYAMAFTAKDKGTTGCDELYGYGIVQVKKAWDFLRQFPCQNALWGKNPGDGTCSAVDVAPRNNIQLPLSNIKYKNNNVRRNARE